MQMSADELVEIIEETARRALRESLHQKTQASIAAASASPSDGGKSALVAEIRQAIVTMRRIATTPSIRRRALTDCQQLDHRASKLEDALRAAGG